MSPVPLRCLALVLLVALSACRGETSREPPVHLNPNMDQQARFDAQEESVFFADGRAMRAQVPGSVAVGELAEDDHLHRVLVHEPCPVYGLVLMVHPGDRDIVPIDDAQDCFT